MCHEVKEVRTSLLIQHHGLAIQDDALSLQAAQNLLEKRIELTELLPPARHQPGLLAIDIQDPAKAIVFQLVDPVGMADKLL